MENKDRKYLMRPSPYKPSSCEVLTHSELTELCLDDYMAEGVGSYGEYESIPGNPDYDLAAFNFDKINEDSHDFEIEEIKMSDLKTFNARPKDERIGIELADEIYHLFERVGAGSPLLCGVLCIIGSWKDVANDEETLESLKMFKTGKRTIIAEVTK